ncbi:unnamed protein product [Adineta steineri]|uniref:Uncharacterized protein n=1 Tax=Adineta steineri TaxID=433720 RepID=A0A818PK07_9BILA|nr:unnamed protein product [Adineta steineri]CAF3621032.1 unnamed protein product [Adineta steineri]
MKSSYLECQSLPIETAKKGDIHEFFTGNRLYSNANAIGIEAEGVGLSAANSGHTNWPEVQYQSYLRGVRALKTAFNVLIARVMDYKEVASPLGRNIDPNFSMAEFRATL